MGRRIIGKLLSHPVVVCDPNSLRPGDILAHTDAESDDIVKMQMRNEKDGQMYDIMRWVQDAENVRDITTDVQPGGDGGSANLGHLDATENNTRYDAVDSGYDGFSSVNVNVPGATVTYNSYERMLSFIGVDMQVEEGY